MARVGIQGPSLYLVSLEFPWVDGKTAGCLVVLVEGSPWFCTLPFTFPTLEGKVSFLFWNRAERGPSAEGQGLLCFLGCDKLRSWAHMELIWWGAGKLACILGLGLLRGEEVRAGERERKKKTTSLFSQRNLVI